MQDSKKPGCLYAARFCQGRDSGYSCNTPVRTGSPKMPWSISPGTVVQLGEIHVGRGQAGYSVLSHVAKAMG